MHTASTDCPPLDDLLDGGLESDAITLVFGEGGSGKTNLALQCARTVAAAGQRVAYIDTEGVSHKRLAQLFDVLPDDVRAAAHDRLLFFSPYTIEAQEQMVKRTASLPDVGLIVVDSINMHYRLHIDAPGGEKEARQSLLQQLHHLTMHARRNHIPVLVTGQVYGGEDATQPFARRTMEHLVKALVRFEKRPDGTRRATILKHRSIEEGRQARFRIGGHGLEPADGAPVPSSSVPPSAASPADAHGPPTRRTGAGPPTGASRREPPGDAPDDARAPRAHRPAPSRPADMPPDARDEARRDAEAWGVARRDEAGGPGPERGDAASPAPGAAPPTTHQAPVPTDASDTSPARPADASDTSPARPADASDTSSGLPADASGASPSHPATAPRPPPRTPSSLPDPADPAAGPEDDDEDAPATSLLSQQEREEAEALPGFSPATSLKRATEGEEHLLDGGDEGP